MTATAIITRNPRYAISLIVSLLFTIVFLLHGSGFNGGYSDMGSRNLYGPPFGRHGHHGPEHHHGPSRHFRPHHEEEFSHHGPPHDHFRPHHEEECQYISHHGPPDFEFYHGPPGAHRPPPPHHEHGDRPSEIFFPPGRDDREHWRHHHGPPSREDCHKGKGDKHRPPPPGHFPHDKGPHGPRPPHHCIVYAIGAVDAPGCTIYSLSEEDEEIGLIALMAKNGHKFIDVLSVDVEVLQKIVLEFEPDEHLPVKELRLTASGTYTLLELVKLEKLGFKMFRGPRVEVDGETEAVHISLFNIRRHRKERHYFAKDN